MWAITEGRGDRNSWMSHIRIKSEISLNIFSTNAIFLIINISTFVLGGRDSVVMDISKFVVTSGLNIPRTVWSIYTVPRIPETVAGILSTVAVLLLIGPVCLLHCLWYYIQCLEYSYSAWDIFYVARNTSYGQCLDSVWAIPHSASYITYSAWLTEYVNILI